MSKNNSVCGLVHNSLYHYGVVRSKHRELQMLIAAKTPAVFKKRESDTKIKTIMDFLLGLVPESIRKLPVHMVIYLAHIYIILAAYLHVVPTKIVQQLCGLHVMLTPVVFDRSDRIGLQFYC